MFPTTKDSRSPLFILLPFTILLVMVIVLSACGGQTTAPEEPAALTENNQDSGSMPTDPPDVAGEPAPTEEMADPEPTAEAADPSPEESALSFAADVFPIIKSRCINCHGGDRIEGELIMRSFEDLMAGGESGQVIVPGDAASSKLVQLVSELKMPKRGPKLTPIQVQTISDWVNQGALNN